LTRDEARLCELQAEEPGARVVRADETLNLDSLTAGQPLLMLVATTAPTPPAPALARPLPQPAD